MGRGANSNSATSQHLLYGVGARHGTTIIKLSTTERAELILAEEIADYQARGGQVDRTDTRTIWKLNDQLHRLNGPAIERADGSCEWYQEGRLHRDDGPAVCHADGDQEWFYHGQHHRDDGPALIYANGDWEWWQHGQLHRENAPACRLNRTFMYYYHNRQHRDNGPSAISDAGDRFWRVHGVMHRVDGPAVISPNGPDEYWLNDRHLSQPTWQRAVENGTYSTPTA